MKRLRTILHAGLWIALVVGILFWAEANWRLREAEAHKARIVDYFAGGERISPPRDIQYAQLDWDKYEAHLFRINQAPDNLMLQIQHLQSFEPAAYFTENITLANSKEYSFTILKEKNKLTLLYDIPSRDYQHSRYSPEVGKFLADHQDQFEIQSIDEAGQFAIDQRQIKTLLQVVPSPQLLSEHLEVRADLPVMRIRVGTEAAFQADGSFQEWPPERFSVWLSRQKLIEVTPPKLPNEDSSKAEGASPNVG